MRFSQSSKYAVLAMVRLAGAGAEPLTVRELAAEVPVPEPYLAKLVPLLARAGLVTAARGRGGGLVLARPATEISLADIVRTIDGQAAFQECLFAPDPCSGRLQCPLGGLWDPVRDELVRFLERTTIAAVAARLGSRSSEEGACTNGRDHG